LVFHRAWEARLDAASRNCPGRFKGMKTTCAAKLRGTDAVTHKEVGRIAQATPLSKHVMRTRVRLQVHVLRREVADTSRAVAYDSLYFPRTLRVKKKSPDQRLQQAGLDAALGQSQNRFRRWRSTTEPLFNLGASRTWLAGVRVKP